MYDDVMDYDLMYDDVRYDVTKSRGTFMIVICQWYLQYAIRQRREKDNQNDDNLTSTSSGNFQELPGRCAEMTTRPCFPHVANPPGTSGNFREGMPFAGSSGNFRELPGRRRFCVGS